MGPTDRLLPLNCSSTSRIRFLLLLLAAATTGLTAGVLPGRAEPLVIAVAGDVFLRHASDVKALHHVAPLFQAADVSIVNLEVPLTTRTVRTTRKSAKDLAARQQFILKGSPAAAKALAHAGIDAVTLANNHTMDYQSAGLQDTLSLLQRLKLQACGAGATTMAARRPALVSAKGARVAVLSYLAFMSAGGLAACTPATDHSAGVAVLRCGGTTLSRQSRQALRNDIANARKHASIVLVALHWGIQGAPRPSAYQRALAHAAIECGASAVVGHHPHVLQGVEWHWGRPICYSLGNFVFAPSHGRLGETGVMKLVFEGGRPTRMVFCPARIKGSTPVPLTGNAARTLAKHVLELSRGFALGPTTVDDSGHLRALWRR